MAGEPKTCADCGCDEARGCVEDRHGRTFFCHMTAPSTEGLPPVLCSFCLDARGYLDLRGGTIRESLVGFIFEMKGRAGLEEMAEEFDRPPEVVRALAALDTPCRACAGRPKATPLTLPWSPPPASGQSAPESPG